MKNYKILTAAACLIALAACRQENPYQTVPGGLDSSKPAVTSFVYDDAASGAKTAGFGWDASKADAAGATSYTIELTADVSVDNPVNTSSVTIVEAPATSAVVSKGIVAGGFYYARIRANYPGFYFSDWTYLGSASSPMVVCVGQGVVAADFGAPANLKTSNVAETSFKASWDAVPFATSYTFEYKPASSGNWEVVPGITATTYEAEGLVGSTTYDIRVKAVKGDAESDYTTGSVTTLEPSKFNANMTKASDFIEFLTSEASLASSTNEYTLEADIDLTGETVPSAESFKGILDGKGHTIKGLKSGKPLFTSLSGTVKNLVIDASCEFAPEVAFFGVIAGESSGTISGVTNKAAVTYSAESVPGPALFAAIAGASSGEISDCINEGAITVTVEKVIDGTGVAGIVGYQAAAVNNCVNKGAITVTAKYVDAKVAVLDAKDALPTTGGVVGYGAPGFSMNGCDNYGTVSYKLSAIDTYLSDSTVNLNRNQHGGIVGSPCGSVSNCHNYGKVDIAAKHSTPGTAILNEGSFKREFILCVGGIGGGDYQFTNTTDVFSNTSYINCVNEGEIIVDSDAAQSNSAIGGIVGWPGQEKPLTGTSVNGCTNKGAITGRGAMKCRIGGIEGGTGVIENSENQGVITLESGNVGSAIGALCGFHSQGHAITGCTGGGEIICKVNLTGGLSGFIGNVGNVDHDTATGCKVNCKITVPEYNAKRMGMVVGYYNGSSKVVVLGSATDPIQVSGSINGVPASADNIYGTDNDSNHTINYVIK